MGKRIPRNLLAAATPVLLLLLTVAGMRLVPGMGPEAEPDLPPLPPSGRHAFGQRRPPRPAALELERGKAYLAQQNYVAAVRDLKVAKEKFPQKLWRRSGLAGPYALTLQKSGNRKAYLRDRDQLVTFALRADVTDDERAMVVRLLVADALSDPAASRLLTKVIEPLKQAARARRLSTRNVPNQGVLGLALCGAGQYRQAIAELSAVPAFEQEGFQLAAMAVACARTGNRQEARRARLRMAPAPLEDFTTYGGWYNNLLLSRLTVAADKALGLRPGQILPSPDPLPRPASRLQSWRLDVEPGMSASPLAQEPDGALRVTVGSPSTSAGSIQLTYPGVVLVPERRYSITFRVRADQPHPFCCPLKGMIIQENANTEWKTIRREFVASPTASVGEDALTLQVAHAAGNIWFRDIAVQALPEQDKATGAQTAILTEK